jgi:outer membrane protein TolC
MNRFFRAALAATGFIVSVTCWAGQGTGASHIITGDLTIDKAVQAALRQNPDILKQLEEIKRTRGQVIEVRAQALPHLTTTGSWNQQDERLLERRSSSSSEIPIIVVPPLQGTGTIAPQFDIGAFEKTLRKELGGSGSSLNGPSDKSWKVDVQVTQVIYAGGQVGAAIKIAKFTEDSSYYQLRDTIDRIVAQVRTQFYNVLLTRALIKVQEESVRLLGDQLKDQQNRFEAGTVPRFNVLRAEVELANQQPQLITARNNYLIAQLQLAKTLGLEPGRGGKPTFNCVGTFDTSDRPMPLEKALELARERRSFLKVQRQQILVSKEQIKVELAGYKPRLDFNAGYELRNSQLSRDIDDTVDGWFYGVTGSWNIFDGGQTYGRVKQARAQLETAKITYDDSVLQVELEVQQSYSNLRAAREVIRSQQKNVEQAQEALRLANERFSAGAGTQLDVLDARVALTQAQTTEIQSRAAYNTELAEYDRVTATDTIYAEMFPDPLTLRKGPRGPKGPAEVNTTETTTVKKAVPVKKATSGTR